MTTKRKNYIYPNATCINVVDGDTMDIQIPIIEDVGFGIVVNTTLTNRFRILNLDTAEIGTHARNDAERAHGMAAKLFATNLLLNQVVTVQSFKGDEYGRYLGVITLSDGKDYATKMIEAGFEKRASY